MAEEIIDAEWVDLPTAPKVGISVVTKARPNKQTKPKAPVAKSSVGRVDILASGLLQKGFEQMTGQKPNEQITGAITKATQMILGKTKAKGPEWDFLQSLMGG